TSIGWFGNSYWLFPDGRSIYSVNGDYIKPLLDEPDYLTFHKRETGGGSFALACKIGLELKAIIAPSHLHGDERHAEEIQLIARLSKSMGLGRGLGAAHELFGEQDAGPPPAVDPETGEITGWQMDFGSGEAEGAENG
ncbi:MAG: hypothetical protein LBL83_06755, partial [Clostridiales bacterium]|nr:hypothetical protein [Clostridiales bacterium]